MIERQPHESDADFDQRMVDYIRSLDYRLAQTSDKVSAVTQKTSNIYGGNGILINNGQSHIDIRASFNVDDLELRILELEKTNKLLVQYIVEHFKSKKL